MKKILTTVLLSAMAGIPAIASAPLEGRVICDGKGVPGVVVTDGFDCVATDADGRFSIEGQRDARFVAISTPAGYLTACEQKTIPQFFIPIDRDDPSKTYDFTLTRNPLDDNRHMLLVQADEQVTSEKDLRDYGKFIAGMNEDLAGYRGKCDLVGLDCGDIVGDSPWLFPANIETASALDLPVYRVIGNHDMTYGGRSYEQSYSKFEELFGPIYYSFNKGKVHYVVLNNNFYVNRDYQYIGYIDERTFSWLEKDLSFVPDDHLIVVSAHIPTSSTKELKWNTLIQDETSNARGLYEMLEGRDAHIITGHSHFNHNVCFNDSLMEHNTAAVCGIWWKADVCVDGTPIGYGVYEFDGNKVKWHYKSAYHPSDYQMRVYAPSADSDLPGELIANVWNYDDLWKVEWLENGKVMGEMTQFTGYDPEAMAICADKERVEYDWIYPVKTPHLFRATPTDAGADLEVRVTDRFGNVYKSKAGK